MTGDLGIIKGVELCHLLSKGPSFREQNNINWNLNRRICKDTVKKYKDKWCKKAKIDKRILDEWEQSVYSYIDNSIAYFKQKCINICKKQVLKKNKHIKYLKDLHKEYVLIPADKVSNNNTVVCKKYYIQVIISDLMNTFGGQNTYHTVANNAGSIIDKHLKYMKTKGITVPLILATKIA